MSLDLDRLDLVADPDAEDHVHPIGDVSEVGVLPVQMWRGIQADVELRVIADLDVPAPRYPDGAFVEGKIAEFGRLAPTARSEPRIAGRGGLADRVAALGDEARDYAMERGSVLIAGPGFLREVRDSIGRLVGTQSERERAALRELDGRLGGR
jgi:hypothetical protein